MRVYLSADMEGVAGVVSWDQCRPGPSYSLGCDLLLGEVNAAIEGARSAGATEVVVNDSHGAMANLDPRLIVGASYLSGRHKPLYMCQGLDATYDCIFYVGYHGGMHTGSNLSHTYNPGAVGEARLNGIPTGEAGLNALVALHHQVPVVLITGDQFVGPEAAPFLPGLEVAVVKESITRTAASALHPEDARAVIRAAAARAMTSDRGLPTIGDLELEVDWLTTDQAEAVGAPLVAPRTTLLTAGDPLELYTKFCTALHLTRALTV
jgi:D-amino peptidase